MPGKHQRRIVARSGRIGKKLRGGAGDAGKVRLTPHGKRRMGAARKRQRRKGG